MLNFIRDNSLQNIPQNTKKRPVVKEKRSACDEIEFIPSEENEPESISSSFLFFAKHKSKARLRAEEEEEKAMREQAEKTKKLERFQSEVQKRVAVLRKMKQQKEIERGMRDIMIARNVIRSCVGLSAPFLDSQSFFVSVDQPDNNLLLPQNQDLPSIHQSFPNCHQSMEARMPHFIPNTSTAIDAYNKPVKIITDDNQLSKNKSYQITGGMEDKRKLYKTPDSTCFYHSKNPHVPTMPLADKSALQETKKQQTLQRSLSRKVFMDMEREQAREVQQQNQQRMELFLLSNSMEATRKEMETSAREPFICSQADMFEEYENPEMIPNTEDTLTKHSLHQASYTRKLITLMQMLEEKCSKINVPVPFLCPCGTSPTDPLRNNCANNCPFYKNPSEYCRALKCLLSSMESTKHPQPFFLA